MPITKERLHNLASAAEQWMQAALTLRQAIRSIQQAAILDGASHQDTIQRLNDLLLVDMLPDYQTGIMISSELSHYKYTARRNDYTKRRMQERRSNIAIGETRGWVDSLMDQEEALGESPQAKTPLTREQQASLTKALAKQKELSSTNSPLGQDAAEAWDGPTESIDVEQPS